MEIRRMNNQMDVALGSKQVPFATNSAVLPSPTMESVMEGNFDPGRSFMDETPEGADMANYGSAKKYI